MNELLQAIQVGILEGSVSSVTANVQAALNEGVNPGVILEEGMVPAMAQVGRLFEEGEYYVPEMLISARAMKAGLAILRPLLASTDVKPRARVAIGTVKGDLHDIGKNLVSMMLEGAAFEILDLGADVPAEKFVEAATTGGAQVIAMSALLTTTMPGMQATIEALKLAGVRESVKVVVGGAPVTQSYADQIGADGYAADASRAVALVTSLVA